MKLKGKKQDNSEVEVDNEESVSTELMDRTRSLVEETFNLKDKGYQLTGFAIKKDRVVVTVTNGVFECSFAVLDGALLGLDQ